MAIQPDGIEPGVNGQVQKHRINAFVSLCKLASAENWCWNLHCSTCGHMYFRYSFMELIKGNHPHDAAWPIKTSRHHQIDGPLPVLLDIDQQKQLLEIVSDARIADIIKVSKFPDWIGYIGLVLFYCEEYERESRLMTKKFVPQLIELLREQEEQVKYQQCLFIEKKPAYLLFDILMDPGRTLGLCDLEIVERAIKETAFVNKEKE